MQPDQLYRLGLSLVLAPLYIVAIFGIAIGHIIVMFRAAGRASGS